MKTSHFTASLSVLLLVACGGGSGSTTSPSVGTSPSPTPSKTIVAVGPISGFGSIIVNGTKFDTSSTQFTVDEVNGSQSDLKVGQVVTVKGTLDAQGNAKADSVLFDELVEGPIASIDLALGEITVLGQTILISEDTSFNDSPQKPTLEDLVIGDGIEVSGTFDENGNIIASLIDPKPGNGIYEISGFITNLDTAAMTFEFNGLTIGYANAGLPEFGDAGPMEGDYASVKGRNFDNGGTFLATRVKKEDDNPGEAGDEGDIEGVITEFTSTQNFSIGGIAVITNADTEFEDGSAADLGLGVRVEVEGEFNEDGVLIADEIEFEFDGNIRVRATVDAIDVDAGNITICGVKFNVSLDTRFDDKSDARLNTFGLADIEVGDMLRLDSFRAADDSLTATRIHRENPRDSVELKDVARVIDADTLSILGVTIVVDENTEFEGFDDEDDITQAEFFRAVDGTRVVEVEGLKLEDGTVLAEELSFEGEEDDHDDDD